MEDPYLPRVMDRVLEDALRSFPVVLLDGARAVGKTRSAARLAASTVRLPEDLERLLAGGERQLRALEPPVLIDEWQLAGEDLLWMLKRIVDDDSTPGRFLLTGSVEPASYGPTFPLTGRAARLVLRPMTRAELDGRGGDTTVLDTLLAERGLRPTASERPRLTPTVGELVVRSGFPAVRDRVESAFFLDGYAALIAQRAGDEGRDASRLLRTMRVLATLEGQAVPDQRVWDGADINKITWKAYDDLLHRTHVVTPSPAYTSNRLKRLTSYPKRYFADVALSAALAGVDADLLDRDPTTAGRYLESWVMQQIRPQVDARRVSLLHLRTGAGEREVDGIIELPAGIVGIEVKHAPRVRPVDAGALSWFRDATGNRFLGGFVVHTGDDTYELDDRIWAVPLAGL